MITSHLPSLALEIEETYNSSDNDEQNPKDNGSNGPIRQSTRSVGRDACGGRCKLLTAVTSVFIWTTVTSNDAQGL